MKSFVLHFDRASRSEVGLEHILQTLASADVDPQSFTPPLHLWLDDSSSRTADRGHTHSGLGLWVEKLCRRHLGISELAGSIINLVGSVVAVSCFRQASLCLAPTRNQSGGLGTFFCLVRSKAVWWGFDCLSGLSVLASHFTHSAQLRATHSFNTVYQIPL